MVVRIVMKMKSGTEQVLENITEIHYNYHQVMGGIRIAFESDIDGHGCSYDITEIDEFEATSQRRQYTDQMIEMNQLVLKRMGVDIHEYLNVCKEVVEDVNRTLGQGNKMDEDRT